MSRHAHPIFIAAAVLSIVAAGLAQAESPKVAFGRRVAERNCSGCHAIGAGRSPNPQSPPFRQLYLRYGRSGLDQLLAEGMLAPSGHADEGGSRLHPRMPHIALDEDEVAALKAYLHSLEPAQRRRSGRR